MIGLLCFVLAVLASPFKSKLRLEAENAVLRHQLNRNMIGAVVGIQPFGGCGLSGTGPKAGGSALFDAIWDRANRDDQYGCRRPARAKARGRSKAKLPTLQKSSTSRSIPEADHATWRAVPAR